MEIRYRFDSPDFWPRFGRSFAWLVLLCLASGYAGLVLGMLVTRRGISELSGIAHLFYFVPLSSVVVGAVVWCVMLGLVHGHTPDKLLEPPVVLTATAVACAVVILLQAATWVLLVRLGAQ